MKRTEGEEYKCGPEQGGTSSQVGPQARKIRKELANKGEKMLGKKTVTPSEAG